MGTEYDCDNCGRRVGPFRGIRLTGFAARLLRFCNEDCFTEWFIRFMRRKLDDDGS